MMPRSFFCNGHIFLNGRKMSKNDGNFLTIKDCIEKFSADATRMALSESGDTLEDANFDEKVANASILKLYALERWIKL